MGKKFVYFILLMVVIFGGVFFFTQNKNQDTTSRDSNQHAESTKSITKPKQNERQEAFIKKIFSLAEQGMVPDTAFVAGKTKMTEVTKQWGDAYKTMQTDRGYYAEYPKHDINLGYRDDVVFDVRSFANELSDIHLKTIKKLKGEPDDVRYYKDNKHNQIILVYQVNSAYQLKWILPKPSADKPNPVVHHISVYTELETNNDTLQVENMKLDEKIGQMIMAGISGTEFTTETKQLIQNYHVGGMILYANNMESPKQTVRLLNKIKTTNAKENTPILLGVDQEGGDVSRLPGSLRKLPTNQKIGSWNNPQLSYKIGSILGEQVREFGFNLDFAPVLDVNSNPNNPVIGNRSFGDDPELVSSLGIQTMKGIESKGVVPVIKHFPGHGDTSVDSHLQLPEVNKSLADLKNLELIPFEHAITHGADVVMVAHILLPKIDPQFPSSMSKKIINDLLREQMEFNGVVITDDMTMKAITNNFDIGKAAVQSVKAGSDLILVAHGYSNVKAVFNAMKKAVKNGEITEERINQSVQRIIRLKEKYELTDEKVDSVNIKALNKKMEEIL